jgi:hypothetical protein
MPWQCIYHHIPPVVALHPHQQICLENCMFDLKMGKKQHNRNIVMET